MTPEQTEARDRIQRSLDIHRFNDLLNYWTKTTTREHGTWIIQGVFVLAGGSGYGDLETRRKQFDFSMLAEVVLLEDFMKMFPKVLVSYGLPTPPIPTPDAKCHLCGKEWYTGNMFDRVDHKLEDDGKSQVLYHNRCWWIRCRDSERRYFSRILEDSGIRPVLKEVANGYSGADDPFPWFEASLPEGDIRIGWRKRVIHIEWLGESAKVDFSALYSDQDVTKGCNMVHAWGADKAVEYLRRLKVHLVNAAPY